MGSERTLGEVSLFDPGCLSKTVNQSVVTGKESYIEHTESPSRRRARKRQKVFNRVIWTMALLAVVGAILTLYLLYGHTALKKGVRLLKELIHSKNPFAYALLVLIQFVFAFVLFLPGLSTFNILQAFLIHDFLISFAIAFGGCYAGSLLVYLVTRSCCKKRMHRKLGSTLVYKILVKETKKSPYRSGILFNFLFVPVSLKNYLVGMSELQFHHSMVGFLPGHAIMNAVCAMIGAKVNDLSEVFGSKNFSKKSRGEKLQFIISMSLLAFTMVFLATLFCIIKRQYNRYQEEEIQEEEAKEKAQAEENFTKSSQDDEVKKNSSPTSGSTQTSASPTSDGTT